MRKAAASLAALLLAAALSGCGDGEDSTSTVKSPPPASGSPAAGTGKQESSADKGAGGKKAKPASKSEQESDSQEAVAPAPPVEHDDSGGGAKQFIDEGADNSIQESGSEASDSERDEAALALHGFLDSTAAGDWGSACFYLSQVTYEQIAASFKLDKPCRQGLAIVYDGVKAKSFAEAAQADVGSFRVEGDRGFLLYHGAGDVDYQMPMAREGGEWKVAAITGSPLL